MITQRKRTSKGKKNKSETSQTYRLPKTHQEYWKERLKKRSFKTRDGKEREIPEFQVQIQHLGRQRWFNLGTTNKEAACIKARDIYLSLKAAGWDKTFQKYKPEMVERRTATTVGELIEEVRKKSDIKEETLATYAQKFRTLVAGVLKIPSTKRKYDYKKGGYQDWLSKVSSVKLSKITPEKVQAWKKSYIKKNGPNPRAEKKAKESVNSIIRNAKGLFSEKALRYVSVELPEGSPFQGIEFEKPGKSRYKSEIEPELLLAAAKNELSKDHPELYKIFILGLGAGLRRVEMDKLQWDQLNFNRSTIRVETTEHTEVKTSESEAEIDVDPDLLEILRSYKKNSKSVFVINSNVEPRQSVTYHHYRCQIHFDRLVKWLRTKGVNDQKPIHALRKEFGSEINKQGGIYAASVQLRHSDIRTTREHYLDKKVRFVVPMGETLKEPSVKVVPS